MEKPYSQGQDVSKLEILTSPYYIPYCDYYYDYYNTMKLIHLLLLVYAHLVL